MSIYPGDPAAAAEDGMALGAGHRNRFAFGSGRHTAHGLAVQHGTPSLTGV